MKVIFIDFSIFLNRSLLGCHMRGEIQYAQFMCMRMIFACLKKIELNEDDLIIFALDSPKGSWRRDIDSNYKKNRRAQRAKLNIDWTTEYAKFAKLIGNLEVATPFHIVEIDRLECDDIVSAGVRYYYNCECIIISTDSDFDQLTKFQNVKLFNPVKKEYKIITDDCYKLIAKKIKKEVTDNLITPILTVEDYERRDLIVNLTRLPEDIESLVVHELKKITIRNYDIGLFQYPKIQYELKNLFNNHNKKIITFKNSFRKKKKRKIKLNQSTLF